jgi:hypothetical protein
MAQRMISSSQCSLPPSGRYVLFHRSTVSHILTPSLQGALGLITKPVKGVFFSLTGAFADRESLIAHIRAYRISQGVERSSQISQTDKMEVVRRWKAAVTMDAVKARRRNLEALYNGSAR